MQTNKIISHLSKELHRGGEIFCILKKKYDRLINTPWIIGFLLSFEDFSGIKRDCDNWSKSVLEYLENQFPNSVYSHQFKTPPQEINPNSKDGWRTRYIKDFQGQIRQLEKIIYALKEEVVLPSKILQPKLDNEALYTLSYDIHTHEVKINGIPIKKLRSFQDNEQIIMYLIDHPNKDIEISEVEKVLNIKISKKPTKFVTELGFSSAMRKIFFPNNTKTTIMFRNPISNQYAIEHRLPRLKIS